MRGALGGLLIGVVLLATGCSAVGGSAAPTEPTAVTEAAGPSGIELPPRPRDVPIDGVDPCALLTPEQRAELGLDVRTVFDLGPSLLYPGNDVPACVMRGFEPRAITVGVSIVTTVGIELFTSGKLAAEVRPVQVRGFPAVVAVPTRFTKYCTVIVDVAPGQLLDVQFADGGRKPPIPQPQLCRDAETVADVAMATLLALY
jgi:hypothetical protein